MIQYSVHCLILNQWVFDYHSPLLKSNLKMSVGYVHKAPVPNSLNLGRKQLKPKHYLNGFYHNRSEKTGVEA